MSLLTSKDQIFNRDDRRYETVHVPEWDLDVRLRSLTGTERDDFESSTMRQVGNKTKHDLRNVRAKLVALSAVDDNGLPLFDPKADVVKLGNMNAAALDRLFSACQRLSGLTDEDVKELEEGFGQAPNGAFPSASPSPSAAAPSPSFSPGSTPASSPHGVPTNGSSVRSDPSGMTTSPR